MSGEPQLTWTPCSTHRSSDGGVEQVGGVDDRRGIAGGRETGRQGAADFARADGVHQRPRAADQIEDRQIGARLLGVADHVEGRQVGDAPADHRGVVDERRRAELPGQFRDRDAGDFSAETRTYVVGDAVEV